MWPHTLASDSVFDTSMNSSQVRLSAILQHALWWAAYEEIAHATDIVGTLFHTKTALWFVRLCIELVRRAAVFVRLHSRAARHNV